MTDRPILFSAPMIRALLREAREQAKEQWQREATASVDRASVLEEAADLVRRKLVDAADAELLACGEEASGRSRSAKAREVFEARAGICKTLAIRIPAAICALASTPPAPAGQDEGLKTTEEAREVMRAKVESLEPIGIGNAHDLLDDIATLQARIAKREAEIARLREAAEPIVKAHDENRSVTGAIGKLRAALSSSDAPQLRNLAEGAVP